MPPIKIQNVSKSFSKTKILHNVCLEVQENEIVCLVGPSGCGKTTLVDIIVGNSLADEGCVLLDGESAPYKNTRKRLGYMPQDTALYEDVTAWDNLHFFGSVYGLSGKVLKMRAEAALDLAWLQDQGKKLVQDYSGGMKRRLSLAIALLCEPKILVMDEPTVGLDPIHRRHLWESFHEMSKSGAALLITTHVMDEAMQCDKVAMMREGNLIAFDSPKAIVENIHSSSLEEAFVKLAIEERAGDQNA